MPHLQVLKIRPLLRGALVGASLIQINHECFARGLRRSVGDKSSAGKIADSRGPIRNKTLDNRWLLAVA
jgi:hypothetical protein